MKQDNNLSIDDQVFALFCLGEQFSVFSDRFFIREQPLYSRAWSQLGDNIACVPKSSGWDFKRHLSLFRDSHREPEGVVLVLEEERQ